MALLEFHGALLHQSLEPFPILGQLELVDAFPRDIAVNGQQDGAPTL
jgi:hypothetical protein